jgi:hypothetical protein
MIRRIIDFSLDNRLLVGALWLLVAGLGVRSLLALPIDAVPDVTNVQVQVLTNSPGLAPEEVERFITFPVETAMSGLPRIAEIRSVSKFGLSVVTVVFEEGTDIYWARQLVAERLTEAREAIPEGYGDLAGHTHGGQIRLPLFGAVITASEFGKESEQSLYNVGPTTLYVSRGLGMEGKGAPRARFLCPPEIVVVNLGSN